MDSVEALAEEEAGSGQVALEAPPAKVEPEPVPEPNKLRPVQLKVVEMFESIPFPIYMKSESTGAFSLLVSKGDQLSESKRRQIQKHSRGMVYIQSKYYAVYAAEAERALDNILTDGEKDVKEKVPLFFSYATERLAEVFRRVSEEGGQNATLVLPVAEQALGLVQQDWKAAFSLLRLAQTHPETYAHSLNVCLFGLSYVQNYVPMYSEGELKEIAFGFLSHDIGELLVSDELLNKKSLTSLERKIIRQIPLHGHKVLMESECDFPLAVEIVMNHHERVDGTGYPRGLAENRIPLLARVCTVCEAFDTMTTTQVYRRGTLTAFEALNQMVKGDRGQFDRHVLANFVRMMGGKPNRGIEDESVH